MAKQIGDEYMKKIQNITFGIIAIIMFVVVFLFVNDKERYIQIAEDKSYFSDFFIQGEKVYIECELTLKNSSSNNITFQLNAIMKDDVELGLLKDENLKGYYQDLANDIFTIGKNETKTYSIVFVGDFAGINKKHDRKLPEIVITVVDE